MSLLEKEQELQRMVAEGQMMEAFEKFYHEDVVMTEPMAGETKGKAANRKREEEWMSALSEVHGGGVHAIAANDDQGTTLTESWGDFSFKDGSRVKVEEVSVKKWENGLIVHERFYYHMPS